MEEVLLSLANIATEVKSMSLTGKELQEAIENTKRKIEDLKDLLAQTADPSEIRWLKRQIKELQILQFWHIDQLG